MDENEVKRIVSKVLAIFHCKKYSYEKIAGGRAGFSAIFSLPHEDALAVYGRIADVNLYAMGWLVRALAANEAAGEYKIDFEKV